MINYTCCKSLVHNSTHTSTSSFAEACRRIRVEVKARPSAAGKAKALASAAAHLAMPHYLPRPRRERLAIRSLLHAICRNGVPLAILLREQSRSTSPSDSSCAIRGIAKGRLGGGH